MEIVIWGQLKHLTEYVKCSHYIGQALCAQTGMLKIKAIKIKKNNFILHL